jgi:hypothetical protein
MPGARGGYEAATQRRCASAALLDQVHIVFGRRPFPDAKTMGDAF